MITIVKVENYQIGLVFKSGKLERILQKGVHVIGLFRQVEIHDTTKIFKPTMNINLLMKNEELASMIDLITVEDNEIALKFENNQLVEVLNKGQYAIWKNVLDLKFAIIDLSDATIDNSISQKIINNPILANYIRKFQIENHQIGLLFIDNKLVKTLTAGIYCFWRNSTVIQLTVIDNRNLQLEIAGQELLTKDKANLRINFYVRYKVADVIKALTANREYEKQLYILMQLALREVVGTLTLDELLNKKDAIGNEIIVQVASKIEELGLVLLDAGIRDVILPGDVKEILNQVLIAEKKAQANTIMRREETASTRSLLNTAKLMEENEMLWKLKEMEYVEKIAEKVGEISIAGSGNVVAQLKEIFTK